MRRLGASVDDVVYSKIQHKSNINIGSKGKVVGPATSKGEGALDRILVVFDDGFRINMHKSQFEVRQLCRQRILAPAMCQADWYCLTVPFK